MECAKAAQPLFFHVPHDLFPFGAMASISSFEENDGWGLSAGPLLRKWASLSP